MKLTPLPRGYATFRSELKRRVVVARIGVAQYELRDRLPAEFKGRLPTAKQLADAVREALL